MFSSLYRNVSCFSGFFLNQLEEAQSCPHINQSVIDSNSTFDSDEDKVSHRRFFGCVTHGFALILAAVLRRQAENLCQDLSASYGLIRDVLVHCGEVLPWICQLGTLLTPNNVQPAALIGDKICMA